MVVGLYLKSVFRLTQMSNSVNHFHISIDHANIVSVSNENSRSHCFKRPTKSINRSTVKLRYRELHPTPGKAPVHVNWSVRFECVSNGVFTVPRVSTCPKTDQRTSLNTTTVHYLPISLNCLYLVAK